MKYNQKEGQICVRTDPTVPIAGPETFLEILEDFDISSFQNSGPLNVSFTNSLEVLSSVLCSL